MAVSSKSPYAQRAATVVTMGSVTDSAHSSHSTDSTTIAHSDSDSDMAVKLKVSGLKKRFTNGQKNHTKRTTMTNPKPLLDTSTSSADVNTVDSPVEVDFVGEVNTNNEIPDQDVLKSVEDMMVFDKEGKTVPFKSLYSGTNVTRRVLIIFIRHFFCGNCQEYLRTLSDSITPEELLTLPTPTFIAVVGHGEPSLIPMYATATRCPFPIYADPHKQLYNALGMLRTLNLGARPEYQRRGTIKGMWESVCQGFSNLKGGKALQGLDWHQVGGEFLFEPINMATPIASPADEVNKQLGGLHGGADGFVEEKQITWVHRMKNTRDHAELPELREVLCLDGVGIPGKDIKRWTKALGERKGTGLSARSSSQTRGGSSGRGSVTVEREKAAAALNGTKFVEKENMINGVGDNGAVSAPVSQ